MKGYLEAAFKEMGLEVSLQHVDSDRYNVIGTTGKGPIDLMLCTHMDVIPALDDSKWHAPPFRAVRKDGKIYGRGSSDAKGSLAAMMGALLRVRMAGREIHGNVAIAAVVEEEMGRSIGAKKIVEEYSPKMTVIGEPTELKVAISHKGAIRPKITVHGKAAHGSSPVRGINAIALMGRVLDALDGYGEEVSKVSDPMLGRSSLEITMIQGGERINVVPDRCSVCIDRRLVRSETIEGAFRDLKEVVEEVGRRLETRIDVELLSAYPPSSVSESEELVSIAKRSVSKAGIQAGAVGFPAGCDMWVFSSKGIPTLVLGPGSLDQAHETDEYIDILSLNSAVDIYEDIISEAAGRLAPDM